MPTDAGSDDVIRLLRAVPAVVAVHGVIAAADSRYTTDSNFTESIFQAGDKAQTTRGRGIAAVGERIDQESGHTGIFRNLRKRDHVAGMTVYAAVADKTANP